jgi:hypothetical protein
MTAAKKTGAKGYAAEEALGNYFRSIGYYVVRGVPLCYRGYDVTDVDLWLYLKPTTISTERACVDIKRKKTPQAMERILWAKGLKGILGTERVIVATTDNRAETREFAAAHDVGILQGEFLQRVIKNHSNLPDRLSSEDFYERLKTPCIIQADVNWKNYYDNLKSRLLSDLNFDTCNYYLNEVGFVLSESTASGHRSEVANRMLYALLSFFLIAFDYTCQKYVHLDMAKRKSILLEAFRYGETGKSRSNAVLNMSLQLLSASDHGDLFTSENLRAEVDAQVADYDAESLAEYFSKPNILKNLFEHAKHLELLAFSSESYCPAGLDPASKAMIGLMCDLHGQDRKQII